MKKFLIGLIFVLAVVVTAVAFKQPTATIVWPWGEASTQTLATAQSADTITVNNNETFVTLDDTLHSAYTIAVTANSELNAGAKLYVVTRCGLVARTTTYSTTASTGFVSTTLSGTASKSKLSMFIYDGTHFNLISHTQIN